MSVRTNQYILAGVKLPFEKSNDAYDRYEPFLDNRRSEEIKHPNGLAVIYDGMNGQYIFVGRILYKSQVNELIDGPIALTEIDPTLKEMLVALINFHFPGHGIEQTDIQTWFVTHYG